MHSFILPINGTLKSRKTPCQSGTENNCDEGKLHIPQKVITDASL